MAMPTLTETVHHAFGRGGPVEQILGQHRPSQTQFALNMTAYITRENEGLPIVPLIKEAFAGCGKTDAVLIVLGLHCVLTERKSLISTFKRSLRGDYLTAMDNANQIIRQTLDDLDATTIMRPVSINEFKSTTSFVSPSKMARLQAQIEAKIIKPDKSLIDFLRCYQDLVAAGIDPEFTDIYEQCPLPDNTTELHWQFWSADRQSELWERIKTQRNEVKNGDIVLVTHSMLVRNSIANGLVLNTNNESPHTLTFVRDGIAMIDEAEQLPGVAYDTMSGQVSLSDIHDLVTDVSSVYAPSASRRGDSIIVLGKESIGTGLYVMNSWLEATIQRTVVFPAQDELSRTMIEALRDIDQGLRRFLAVAQGAYHEQDQDAIIADEIIRMRQELAMIMNSESFDHSKVAIKAFRDERGNPDVQVIVNYSAGRHLINQLWRTPHSFCGVAMISATLTDIPPYQNSYSRFLTAIGYDPAVDHILQDSPLVPIHQFGHIREVAVADRLAPHPTDSEDADFISQSFIQFATNALTALAERQRTMAAETRMLVLFPSYRLLDRVAQTMPEMLRDRINKTRKGSNLKVATQKFADMPYGIWFGVEWEGVNFAHPDTKRTLADLMVIVRLPQPPSDDIRIQRLADVFGDTSAAQRRAEWVALREASNSAYRRTVHGVGRGLRNAHDVVQLLTILDIRFPVPLHVADTRHIARSAGDPTKIFSNFDTCLETYRVQHWSQVNLDGSLTRIL
jgi:Rad3-related DNA helicase